MLAQHIRRLRHSAELVYIDLRVDDEQICREVEQAVVASKNDECYVRLTLTRGVGDIGLDPELSQQPCRILIVAPLHRPPSQAYRSGIRAITYKTLRTTESTEASGAKIGNYLVAVLAMRRAKLAQANEALIVNGDGRVVEGATSNLFYRVGAELITPPVSAGILPGITRELVLEVAERLSWRLRFYCPTTDELSRADEVFITSSVREILPVVTVDDQSIGGGQPGPMYSELWQGYQGLANEKLAAVSRLFVP